MRRGYVKWRRAASTVMAVAFVAAGASSCKVAEGEPAGEDSTLGVRSYKLGFANIPPTDELALAVRSLQLWAERADAAIYVGDDVTDEDVFRLAEREPLVALEQDLLVLRGSLQVGRHFGEGEFDQSIIEQRRTHL